MSADQSNPFDGFTYDMGRSDPEPLRVSEVWDLGASWAPPAPRSPALRWRQVLPGWRVAFVRTRIRQWTRCSGGKWGERRTFRSLSVPFVGTFYAVRRDRGEEVTR